MTMVWVDDKNPLILFTVWYEICMSCVHNGYVQITPTQARKTDIRSISENPLIGHETGSYFIMNFTKK